MGVAPYDRIAAHIGLSDDDLLDFESDDAEAPNQASVVNRDKLQRPKLSSRVSSEVYRLEQNVQQRSREGNKAQQNHKGRQISRNGGSGDSRRSMTPRRSFHEPSTAEVAPAEGLTRRKSSTHSLENEKSVSGSRVPPQERRTRRSSSKLQKTEEPPQPAQPAATLSTSPSQAGQTVQRRGTSFRRLSEMSPEEKAFEKQRLQALVKEFAREAVDGIDLKLFDVDRGRTVTATFSMDRHLLEVTIDSQDDSEVPSAHFGVGSLTGAFKAEDYYTNGSNLPHSADPSTALVLTTKEVECPKVVLAFNERRERDKAYTCVKILRLSVDLAKK